MSTTKKRLSAAERREQLIGVGRAVFADTGFENASLDVIAQRAGVTKPIIYEHFGGKEGLLAAIVDRELEDVVNRVSEAMEKGSARERFDAAVMEFMTYADEEPEGFALLTRETPIAGREGITRVVDQLIDRVGAIFRREFARAGYDRRVAPLYASAILGMVTQAGRWWADGRKVSRDEAVRHIAALGWMGLRHLPKKPAKIKGKR
ncbi:MAG: TetR/AcrR family transcriptional regulator [Acidobacteriota bacterium]|nr:TetR/AcrR family transcriptional regulator [Acidobacteriota bacterium]